VGPGGAFSPSWISPSRKIAHTSVLQFFHKELAGDESGRKDRTSNVEHRTPNIEAPTPDDQRAIMRRFARWTLDVGCSTFDVLVVARLLSEISGLEVNAR
jgi:hypothetical protein